MKKRKKKKNEIIFTKGIERKEIICDEKEMYYKCIKKISYYNIFFNMYVGNLLINQ